MGALLAEFGRAFLEKEMFKLVLIFAAGFLLATYVPSTAATVKGLL